MRHATFLTAITALALLSWLGCESTPLEPVEELAGDGLEPAAQQPLDPALCALDRPGYTLESQNPYFPLGVGSRWLLEGEEDGESIRVRIKVLNRVRNVGGVLTRVIEEREWVDGELLEVSRNFFAEASDGTTCYFGEEVDIYEDGVIVSHDGAWRADEPGNSPGIFMPADPQPGMTYAMENAPGVAEDQGRIIRSHRIEVPAGFFKREETVWVQESNPLAGGEGDVKVFAEGVGLVVDGPVELLEYQVVD